MVLNPRKIFNDARIHMMVRRGNDTRVEVFEPSTRELVWGEWLENAMKPTTLQLLVAGGSMTVTLIDDGEKPWGIQMGGNVGNQRLIVGGSKDFNIRVQKNGEDYYVKFECIGGDFDGNNTNANTEFKLTR